MKKIEIIDHKIYFNKIIDVINSCETLEQYEVCETMIINFIKYCNYYVIGDGKNYLPFEKMTNLVIGDYANKLQYALIISLYSYRIKELEKELEKSKK